MDNQYITAYHTSDGTRYRVRIPGENGERVQVGAFASLEEARIARDAALIEAREVPVPVGYYPGTARTVQDLASCDRAFSRPIDGARDVLINTPAGPAINVPSALNALPEPPLTLILSRWLYAADFHAPLHSVNMVRRLVQVGRSRKVRDLVIGGDFLDLAHISRHGRATRLVGGREAARVAGELLAFLLDEFNVYILPGNHDDRVAKKLDDDWSFKNILYGMLEGRTFRNRLTVTDDYAYIYVQGVNRKWIVGHPNFFAGFGAKGPAHIAQLQQCSVIGAHNHLQGISWSADGKHIAIDPGCMTEAELAPYVMKHSAIGKYAAWRQGFVIVDNDIPMVCADGLVDWRSIGGE